MFKVLFVFSTVLVAAFAAPTTDDDSHWRVVGGSDAAVNEFPYQASLRSSNSNSHFCGGALINFKTVLTAAHCVEGRTPASTVIVVGTIYLNSGGVQRQVNRITIHSYYNSNTLVNDIAVVVTDIAIPTSESVLYIAVPTVITGAGVAVELSGWGTTSVSGSLSNTLQKITLATISDEDCKNRLSSVGETFDTQVCTLTKAGEGACFGDSGSPLVDGNRLVGIVSWGTACALGNPDVFSRASSYERWISTVAQIS